MNFLQGFLGGQQAFDNFQKQKMMKEQMAMLPDQLKAQLAKQQAEAMMAQTSAQYQPQQIQSQIALNQARIPQLQAAAQLAESKAKLLPQQLQAQIAWQQAQLPNIQAQTEALKQKTQFYPQQMAITQQNAYTKALAAQQSRNRFNDKNTLIRAGSTPAVRSLLDKNPQFAATYARVLSGTASQLDNEQIEDFLTKNNIPINLSNLSGPQNQEEMNSLVPAFAQMLQQQKNSMQQTGQQPQMQIQQPQPQAQMQSLQQAMQGSQQAMQGSQNQLQNQIIDQLNQMYGLTPDVLKGFQGQIQSENLKKATTTRQQNAILAGQIADDMYNQMDEVLPRIQKFSGIKGDIRQFSQKGKAKLGIESDDYDDYIKFMKTDLPVLAGKLRNLSLSPNTEQEVKAYINVLAEPQKYGPKVWENSWKGLAQTLKTLSQTEAQPLAQVAQRLQQTSRGDSVPQPVSELSVAAQPIVLPTFKSKEEFQNYYRNLTPAEKEQVKRQLAQGNQ